uniref:FAR1 domain-containing protein n=1 Tax=Oryza punctata TaxID=4537 RepID=A0A0E0MKT6_ORYPU
MEDDERGDGDELIADYVDCLMSLDTNSRSCQNDTLILEGAPDDVEDDDAAAAAAAEQDVMRDFAPANADADAEHDPKEPMLGMTFESDEAAKMFYNEYARWLGFPFRVGRSRRSKGMEEVVIMKRFVCSREGAHKKKQASTSGEATSKRERASMREGCNAMMEVVRGKDHWVVSKLEKAHNHSLGIGTRYGYLSARESCVIESETISTFETSWMSILEKYDLKKNAWLQAIYNIRQKWEPNLLGLLLGSSNVYIFVFSGRCNVIYHHCMASCLTCNFHVAR